LGDYDNDGYLDLLVVSGQSTPTELLLFHNQGTAPSLRLMTPSPV